MINLLYIKRIFLNKIYWISVIAALALLLCGVIYTDSFNGKTYMFVSLFYDNTVKEALEYGMISIEGIVLGYDTSYLWMFCPIIVGIPCIFTKKTERFLMFRAGKNKYLLSKYFTNLFASGSVLLIAYLIYMFACMIVVHENIWNEYIARKMLSVFCWGVISAIPSIVLSEFVKNKYLILCIPFVLNYFICSFVVNILPYDIWKYISPFNYQIMFLYDKDMMISLVAVMILLILVCGGIKKLLMERRCDCGM